MTEFHDIRTFSGRSSWNYLINVQCHLPLRHYFLCILSLTACDTIQYTVVRSLPTHNHGSSSSRIMVMSPYVSTSVSLSYGHSIRSRRRNTRSAIEAEKYESHHHPRFPCRQSRMVSACRLVFKLMTALFHLLCPARSWGCLPFPRYRFRGGAKRADLLLYLRNNHTFASVCCASPMNPFGKFARIAVLFSVLSLRFAY